MFKFLNERLAFQRDLRKVTSVLKNNEDNIESFETTSGLVPIDNLSRTKGLLRITCGHNEYFPNIRDVTTLSPFTATFAFLPFRISLVKCRVILKRLLYSFRLSTFANLANAKYTRRTTEAPCSVRQERDTSVECRCHNFGHSSTVELQQCLKCAARNVVLFLSVVQGAHRGEEN